MRGLLAYLVTTLAFMSFAGCHSAQRRYMSPDSEPFQLSGFSHDDSVAICETAFRQMFKSGGDWHVKIDRRFITVMHVSPDDLVMRFKGDAPPVESPYVPDPSYKSGDFIPESEYGNRGVWGYIERGDGSLFYSITSVRKVTGSKAVVRCGVVWDILASRVFEYTLKKKDGVWRVVEQKASGGS